MDSVGSLVSQKQPLQEPPERWQGSLDASLSPGLPPALDAMQAPAGAPSLSAPLASPSASMLHLASPQGPLAPPAALVCLPASPSQVGLPAAPSLAPLAPFSSPPAPASSLPAPASAAPTGPTLGDPAKPTPGATVLAKRRANRLHRRHYTLPDPFGIRRKAGTKRRSAPALPARLADLIGSRHTVARVAHRLTRHRVGWHWFRAAFAGPIARPRREAYNHLVLADVPPMAALVLTGLLAHTGAWSSRGHRARLIEGLALLDGAEIAAVARYLFDHPGTARLLRRAYMVQERLELYQGGDSFATYLRFARHFGRASTPRPKTAEARAAVLGTTIQLAAAPVNLGQRWQAHGRTLHFFDNDGTPMGLKLRKDAIDATALEREDVMDQCFAKWKPQLGLLGTFPRSLGLLLFAPDAQVRSAVAAQASAHGAPQFDIGTAALMPALLYQTPEDYHVHLHEVTSLQALEAASHKALHDAGVLAGRTGLVHMSPADFYHNREKDRRWYWNVDQVKKAMDGRIGTGRLDRVDAGVRYYNAGPSGLRDLKHFAFFDDVKNEYGDDATLALTSTMGDFLLAWTLSVCKWFKDHDQLDMGMDLQAVLEQGFTTYFAAFTQRTPESSKVFMTEMVDWPLLARQIRYFCSEAYVADVTQGRLPRHVLNAGATAAARLPEEGWDPLHGWRLDGKIGDLGPKNGPFPLTELISALYTTTNFAVALRAEV